MANKIVNYVKESYDELKNKVSWPSWSELQNSAIVVSVASLIIALVVFSIDITLKTVIEQMYRLF
ncbi:MAG: preprotein translocase subunit SecE [Bacteroidota bacterium]|jgi:preprotein translocase subunit SecE